jgi:hypothetical protein
LFDLLELLIEHLLICDPIPSRRFLMNRDIKIVVLSVGVRDCQAREGRQF